MNHLAVTQGPSLAATTFEDDAGVPGVTETAWDLHKRDFKYPPLTQDASADVCVIGAGITGACVAYSLQKAGECGSRQRLPRRAKSSVARAMSCLSATRFGRYAGQRVQAVCSVKVLRVLGVVQGRTSSCWTRGRGAPVRQGGRPPTSCALHKQHL